MPPELDAHLAEVVARLERAGKPADAAAECVRAGAHARASELYELACDFSAAAREALAARDGRRAAHLAMLAGDEAACRAALRVLVDDGPRDAAIRAAGDLAARGFSWPAGELYAALGEHLDAARAFADARDACRAAACFERAGRPAEGARVLEAAIRAQPADGAARLELGRLLARHGRTEAAVKALQQLDPSAPERAQALPLLARCLTGLGLEDAAAEVRAEMAKLGVEDEANAPEPAAEPAAPARASARPPAAVLFGRYEIVREVAMTPHARVVEAIDRITSERVALKVLAASLEGTGRDALQRFEREARALAQLRHPHVVPLRAYLPEGPAMVLAWMSGGSLADLMRREPVAPARAVEIVGAVLLALGEAHRLGILHRDIKPANVMFDDIGTARLGDFGAAHLGDLSNTATAGAIGTFAYMAPEQRLGKPASVATDLYGAGALLYELCTGEPAEPAVGGQLELPPSVCHPDLDASHDALFASLLDQDPRNRPEDAFEARRALLALRWSTRLPDRDAHAPPTRVSDRPATSQRARLTVSFEVGDGRDAPLRWRDTWLERDVLVVPIDDASLARARAFAQAGHPALPTVLRVDAAAQQIWIAPPRGKALADEARAVGPAELARLGEAVTALHAATGAHGSIDAAHLYRHDGELVLAWPRAAPGPVDEGAARDREALARLG